MKNISPSIVRHLIVRNNKPYEKILRYVKAKRDIWCVSQGDYMRWWLERERATLSVLVENGQCRVGTSLQNGVIQQLPGQFLETDVIPCPNASFSGPIIITIDQQLQKKALLVEILQREGILNYEVGDDGPIFLSQAELAPLLADIEASIIRRKGKFQQADIAAVSQIIGDKLATCGLPFVRLWYHPRVDGIVMRAVFSPRYDVDRAITNLGQIRTLEKRYNIASTFYVRAFCPFYTDNMVASLAKSPWCSEIVLHGEFVTTAQKFGDEMKAAQAERHHLEQLTGQTILGVGMHGGELKDNRTTNTDKAISQAGILYDSTPRPVKDFLPSKKLIDGQFSSAYTLSHALGDIEIEANSAYAKNFYNRVIAKMDEIYDENGVFVLMLHPVYFGFFNYLFRPQNWQPLFKFALNLF